MIRAARPPLAEVPLADLPFVFMKPHVISMLGTGLIADFYTMTLHGQPRSPCRRLAIPPIPTAAFDAGVKHLCRASVRPR